MELWKIFSLAKEKEYQKVLSFGSCECTYNVRKYNNICTIFAVLINLNVNSRLIGFHDHRIYEYMGNLKIKINSF